jgi:hypothetical protein
VSTRPSSGRLGAEQERYLEQLTLRLGLALAEPHEPVAVYLSGSAVLGDWAAAVSDLDVIAITAGPLPGAVKQRVLAAVDHRALPCPARGLELVVYTRDAVSELSAPVKFELNFNTGPGMPEHHTFDAGAEPGHWFLLDLAVARSHGRALLGPRPDRVIGPAAPRQLLEALAESIRWHSAHDRSGVNRVLNACRAWRYAVEGVWSSKGAAARWALEQGWDAETITAALKRRENGRDARDW